MKKTASAVIVILLFLLMTAGSAGAFEEGTRHITGNGMNIYFMNDKVFGTAGDHPLWAIYTCGTAINGEIDIRGTYHKLSLSYHRDGKTLISGTFGPLMLTMGRIEQTPSGLIYPVMVGEKPLRFTIRYEHIEDRHMVNSIIDGTCPDGKPLHLIVDGRLCPFATSGIIMIAVGAAALAG